MDETKALAELEAVSPMSAEEFRRAAYRHADWIAEYFDGIRGRRVLPEIEPGTLVDALSKEAPETGESIAAIFGDFENRIVPTLTLWNHPKFFAYFSISATPPSILAEFLTAALNVNAMLWKSSPGATELELVTLRWLRHWIGLDEPWFGIIYDTASISVMQAMGAAREWTAPECRVQGMRGDLTVYISEHTHSSSEKAAITLGFGQENVRKIAVDHQFRMRPDLLAATIEKDVAAGKRPCCIVASIGSTSTSAIDPLAEIAEVAERFGVWLHVDAAYGGSAAIVPEMRHILTGVERAHSVVLNCHKWLYVSIDCSVLYTRFPEILRQSSALGAEYLRTAEDDRVVNYMDYGIQLGRRFRALKLWYVFRYYGRQGIVAMLRESLRLAQILRSSIEDDSSFELSAPAPLSLVCFRYRSGNSYNQQLLAQINASGKAFLSHTVLNGNFVLRFAIGNFQTTEQDVRETWDLIRATAQQLSRETPA